MTVRTLFVMMLVAGLAGVSATGCIRNQTKSDDDRYRGMMPASRSKDSTKTVDPNLETKAPLPPPNIVPPTPDERPVVPAEFNKPAAPFAIPTAVPEADDAKDPPRPIRNIIQRRRDEREQKAEPKKPDPKAEDKPTLPSPFVKDKKDDGPMGVEFPSPGEATAKPMAPKAKSSGPDLDAVKKVYILAKQKWDALTDYEAKLVRKEVIGGKDAPVEEMNFQFRKEPYSVHTKNTGAVGRGRELIYVAGPGAKVHIVTGEGDNRLVGPGFYTVLSPDDKMMTSKSRHKITEGAVGRTVELLGKAVDAAEAGKFNGLRSLGRVNRKEYTDPVEGIEATIPPGQDPELPKGGKREVYFDANPQSPSYGLPVLIRLLEGDRELEYYCFTQFKVPANLTNADFDTSRLGKKK